MFVQIRVPTYFTKNMIKQVLILESDLFYSVVNVILIVKLNKEKNSSLLTSVVYIDLYFCTYL